MEFSDGVVDRVRPSPARRPAMSPRSRQNASARSADGEALRRRTSPAPSCADTKRAPPVGRWRRRAISRAHGTSRSSRRSRGRRLRSRSPARGSSRRARRDPRRRMSGLACTIGQAHACFSVPDARHLAQHRREDERRRSRRPSRHEAVIELHRRAERDVRPLDPALQRLLARRSSRTTTSKPSSWMNVAKNGKRPLSWNSSVIATVGRPRRSATRATMRLDERLALAERIGREVRQLLLARALVPERAAAAPGEALLLAADHACAMRSMRQRLPALAAALRRSCRRRCPCAARSCASRKRAGSSARALREGDVLAREQRDAERADRARVRRHDDLGCRSGAPPRRRARPRRTACPGRRRPDPPSGTPFTRFR